jgi:uncharacterized membrane protein
MDREQEARAADEPAVFDAVLTPHRSLPARGFVLLMTAICVVSFAAGLLFFLVGAWPVVGFFGLDVLLIYLAFRINYRRARMYETLHLTHGALTVRRVDYRGEERRWSFQPTWLQVLIDEPARHDSQLTLRSHGKSLVIGRFLAPRERADLARALRAAIAQLHAAPETA